MKKEVVKELSLDHVRNNEVRANWQMRSGSQIHRRTIMKNILSTENWSESLNITTEISLEVI